MIARRRVFALSLALSAPVSFAVDGGVLTLDHLYHPEKKLDFEGDPVGNLEWLEGGEEYLQHVTAGDDDAGRLVAVRARNGRQRTFVDGRSVARAFSALPGIGPDDARTLAASILSGCLATEVAPGRAGDHRLSPDRTSILVNHRDDLFLYDIESGRAERLTHDPHREVGEDFSPDGAFVSFVRGHDLHLVELATRKERALTADGSEELLYGRLDWVYQEELYGRGNFKGYWWSPDSKRLAFLRLDESPVHDFTVVDHLPTRLGTEITRYPKAGDPNPTVALGIVDVAGGGTRWVDTSRYAPIEHLIVRVSFTPDSERLVFQVQDREQTWLDLVATPLSGGEVRRLFRETSPAWVGVTGEPHWLDDGTFLWLSDRTGFRHAYHYDGEGRPLGTVTSGRWEVRRLHGHDPGRGVVYLTATEHGPTEEHLYRVRLDGTGLERITRTAGTHRVRFNDEFTLFLDRWSDVLTPPKLFLHEAGGERVRVVDENEIPALSRLALGEVRFLQVPARDGYAMEAMMITPPGFDESGKYPVLQYIYGGPHAPVVRNRWAGRRFLWHQMLAQRGYVIWMCDNRSASGKGVEPTWEAYGRLGVVELRDTEDGVAWLRSQPYVDGERIGIWGWSYGGFMASYALTHSQSFKMGIAGAPVTDWRLYDSIYTERYMKRPQNNPEGYASTSVVEAAGNLSGKLLLVHGTTDDNVHLQNTVQLVHALQQAGKEFELMIYPRSRHRVRDPNLLYHLQRLMTRFIEENL